MKVYRYEYDIEGEYKGILVGLDDIFDDTNELLSAAFVFERYLPEPNIESMINTKSYFTEKGNRKFSKAIRTIKKISENHGIKVITIIKDYNDLENIVYEDKYQVVISSTTSS